ncbi:hypothetical protein K466DRAFT_653189 [Polyporus arcularius HHB13444]|uniref:Uncharacterized protein n=1 Tax=Polyporus arcularius HHB13444 TaxID=1314778 RepID=A0A5C3PDT3_9APHY|nr:hypothetical protein K466DRAFT_653189 [Polyporus arcularius HHB13444]
MPAPIPTLLSVQTVAVAVFLCIWATYKIRAAISRRRAAIPSAPANWVGETEREAAWRSMSESQMKHGKALVSLLVVILLLACLLVLVLGELVAILVEAVVRLTIGVVRFVLEITRLVLELIALLLALFLAHEPVTIICKNALHALAVFFFPHHFDDACPQKWPFLSPRLADAPGSRTRTEQAFIAVGTFFFPHHFDDACPQKWPFPGLATVVQNGIRWKHYQKVIIATAVSVLAQNSDFYSAHTSPPNISSVRTHCMRTLLTLHDPVPVPRLDVAVKYPAGALAAHASLVDRLLKVLDTHHVRSTRYFASGTRDIRHLHRYDGFVPDWMHHDPAFRPNWVPRVYRRCCGCTVWEWRGTKGALICPPHKWGFDVSIVVEVKWARCMRLI